jgi:Rrf2 family protein
MPRELETADLRLALVDDPSRLAVSARTDAAMRALLELAATPAPGVRPAEWLAARQSLTRRMLEPVLLDLSRAGLIIGLRGNTGGYRLAVPADEITMAEVVVSVDRAFAAACGLSGRVGHLREPADGLDEVWFSVRRTLRELLESVTVSSVLLGRTPSAAQLLAQ